VARAIAIVDVVVRSESASVLTSALTVVRECAELFLGVDGATTGRCSPAPSRATGSRGSRTWNC